MNPNAGTDRLGFTDHGSVKAANDSERILAAGTRHAGRKQMLERYWVCTFGQGGGAPCKPPGPTIKSRYRDYCLSPPARPLSLQSADIMRRCWNAFKKANAGQQFINCGSRCCWFGRVCRGAASNLESSLAKAQAKSRQELSLP